MVGNITIDKTTSYVARNDLLIALMLGVIGIALLKNTLHDNRLLVLISISYLACVIYLAKRQKKSTFSKDRDLGLSISEFIYQQTPHKNMATHFIFFRQADTCTSIYWNGRFISELTTFQLSDEALNTLTGLVDDLHTYYRINRLGEWNVLHFNLAANKRKYDFKVRFEHELEGNTMSFQDYLNRYSSG